MKPNTSPSMQALQVPQVLGAPQVQNRELSDPNWRKYFDMLKAAGVDELSTAEASDMNDPFSKLRTPNRRGDIRTSQPGFFDTQGRGGF